MKKKQSYIDSIADHKFNIQFTESSIGKFSSVASLPLKTHGYLIRNILVVRAKSSFSFAIASQLPLKIEGSRKKGTLTINKGPIKDLKFDKLSQRSLRIRYSRGISKYSLILRFDKDSDPEKLEFLFDNIFKEA